MNAPSGTVVVLLTAPAGQRLPLGRWAALTALLLLAVALPVALWLPLARRGAGPILAGAAVGAAAWGAGRLTEGLWAPLARSTFWLVRQGLVLVYPNLYCDAGAAIIGTDTFAV